MQEINVFIVEFGDRPHYQMQYRDPITRRKVTRSTRVERTGRKKERTEAERVAAKWEADLREGRYKAAAKITWAEFRERYENEVVASFADRTAGKIANVFNAVEKHINPRFLASVNAQTISKMHAAMRDAGRAESTIKGHLAHLMAALNWGVEQELLGELPKVKAPQRAKKQKVMKGRPITTEEFERMLAKADSIVGVEAIRTQKEAIRGGLRKRGRRTSPVELTEGDNAQGERITASWRFYLRGLWLSGLRLEESTTLSWDKPNTLQIDLTERRPVIRIPAELEKGNTERLWPIVPEFAEFLLQLPEAERTGYVFNPLSRRSTNRLQPAAVGKIVSEIGEAAGVKVNTSPAGRVKFASAHDLRRAFGLRWSRRVMPAVLKELMRHESIETTMRFYVGQNAMQTADALWDAFEAAGGNSLGNSDPNPPFSAEHPGQANPNENRGLRK